MEKELIDEEEIFAEDELKVKLAFPILNIFDN
jgi:hypothetical protein